MNLELRVTQLLVWLSLAVLGVFAWLSWGASWYLLALGIGLCLGMGIWWLDELLGMKWYEPIEGVPLTRSTLFLVILVPLSIFILTSSGSVLGVGLIIGLLLATADGIVRHSDNQITLQEWLPVVKHLQHLPISVVRWVAVSIPWLIVLLAWVGFGA